MRHHAEFHQNQSNSYGDMAIYIFRKWRPSAIQEKSITVIKWTASYVCLLYMSVGTFDAQKVNYELTRGYLDLIVTYFCIMIIVSRVEDRKAVLGLFNFAYELQNGKKYAVDCSFYFSKCWIYYFVPDRGGKVLRWSCLSVCLSASICPEPHVRSSPVFCMLLMFVARSSSGSIAMLCTSGFVDDVIFARNRTLSSWK